MPLHPHQGVEVLRGMGNIRKGLFYMFNGLDKIIAGIFIQYLLYDGCDGIDRTDEVLSLGLQGKQLPVHLLP